MTGRATGHNHAGMEVAEFSTAPIVSSDVLGDGATDCGCTQWTAGGMMAIDERTRHELHQRLDQVLGVDQAATLMAHLPPTGWGDVVTREYLDLALQAQDARLESRFAHVDAQFAQVDARFAQVDGRFAQVDGRLDRLEDTIDSAKHEILAAVRGELVTAVGLQTRTMIFAMIAALVSLGTLAFALARFA